MAYKRQNLKPGDVFRAAHVERIEDALVNIATKDDLQNELYKIGALVNQEKTAVELERTYQEICEAMTKQKIIKVILTIDDKYVEMPLLYHTNTSVVFAGSFKGEAYYLLEVTEASNTFKHLSPNDWYDFSNYIFKLSNKESYQLYKNGLATEIFIPCIDISLKKENYAADAKIVGDKFSEMNNQLSTEILNLNNRVDAVLGGVTPEELNTLKELSDALNDDEDFAATVVTELSNLNNTKVEQSEFDQTVVNIEQNIATSYEEVISYTDEKVSSIPKSVQNFQDGSSTGSVRSVGSAVENTEYTLGTNAFASGVNTKASGQSSHAEGTLTVASGLNSHAEGEITQASGSGSHAEGGMTKALGEHSHAEGDQTEASGLNAHAEGSQTIAKGIDSHAEGSTTSANSECAHSEGKGTQAKGKYSHAEGYNTIAGHIVYADTTPVTADYAHAEGNTTLAKGEASHAEGDGTYARGKASHAEGYQTVAGGENLPDEGIESVEIGNYTHAEGIATRAIAEASHAEGNKTYAYGAYSHAEGYNTVTQGMSSHAEGFNTSANMMFSHSEGSGTIAASACQHVQGRFNVEDSQGTYAHIIGNGTSSARSNALTVDWDGNTWCQGNVESSGIILRSTTAGSNKRFLLTVDDSGQLTTTEITE